MEKTDIHLYNCIVKFSCEKAFRHQFENSVDYIPWWNDYKNFDILLDKGIIIC